MQVKVLKAFDYAHDGVTVKRQNVGDTPHVRDALVPGLKADGFVGDLSKADKPTPAPEPKADEKPAPGPKADAKA